MARLLSVFAGITLTCFFLVGCGGSVAVEGNVTVDNQPLETGNLAFHPVDSKGENDAVVGHASIEKGKYTLFTNGKAGIAPGSYKVVVNANAPPDASNPYALPVSLVDKKYTQLETTTLTVEVAPGNSPEKYNLALTK